MPLPISRTAMDALGRRLAAAGEIPDADADLVLQVLDAYQDAENAVQTRLRALGYAATSRTKTTSVLIDKLQRETTSLKSVQDIAGARIVCDGDRDTQDDVVNAVVAEFSDGLRPPKVKDRRVEPSYGYRAVHVVVDIQGLPVEIQIRTRAQDQWAQIVESLGDRWGRGIRYGLPVPDPDAVLFDGPQGPVTRGSLWQLVTGLSEAIDSVETLQASGNGLTRMRDLLDLDESRDEDERHTLRQEIDDLLTQAATNEQRVNKLLAAVAAITRDL